MVRQNFPAWYFWVKWALPISLAIGASAWLGLTLTATIPAYGMLKWAPVFFSSLEGLSAAAVLTFAMGAVASMVGVGVSILSRAILSHVSEDIAKNNISKASYLNERCQEQAKVIEELREKFAKEREEADKAIELAGQGQTQPQQPLQFTNEVQPDLPVGPELEATSANDEKQTQTKRAGKKR